MTTHPIDATAHGRAREVTMPPDARALGTLADVDYEDAFLVETRLAEERTGEQWARAMLEGAPATKRRALRWVWTAVGVRLGPAGSERHVLGLEIQRSSPDFLLLRADSRFGVRAEVLLMRRQGAILCCSFVRPESPVARALWAGVKPVHRRAVPDLLGAAARRAARLERMDES